MSASRAVRVVRRRARVSATAAVAVPAVAVVFLGDHAGLVDRKPEADVGGGGGVENLGANCEAFLYDTLDQVVEVKVRADVRM